MNSRKEFDLEGTYNGEYDPLLSSNDNFASDNFDDLINSTPKANSKKRGLLSEGALLKLQMSDIKLSFLQRFLKQLMLNCIT